MTTDDWHNPYFEEVAGGVIVGGDRWGLSEKHIETSRRRKDLVEQYAWAIPNAEAIETIAEYEPILEVGAGKGYWAHLLRQLDVDLIATDPEPAPPDDTWAAVWKAKAQDVVTDYPERTLLMVWPSGIWTVEALGAYRGDTLVYVGEGRGGCCAHERFHEMLFAEWSLTDQVPIPRYHGISDRLEVWERDD